MNSKMKPLLFITLVLGASIVQGAELRPRLLVLTDIGGDPDDQQAMVRLLVHSSEFDIEGLVLSASGTPGELKERVTKPQLIREQIDVERQRYAVAHALSSLSGGGAAMNSLVSNLTVPRFSIVRHLCWSRSDCKVSGFHAAMMIGNFRDRIAFRSAR